MKTLTKVIWALLAILLLLGLFWPDMAADIAHDANTNNLGQSIE